MVSSLSELREGPPAIAVGVIVGAAALELSLDWSRPIARRMDRGGLFDDAG